MNPISIAHEFLRDIITEGDTVIDATMGNGHDTVFLAGLGARVFAFDVGLGNRKHIKVACRA